MEKKKIVRHLERIPICISRVFHDNKPFAQKYNILIRNEVIPNIDIYPRIRGARALENLERLRSLNNTNKTANIALHY